MLSTIEFQEFMDNMNDASEHALFWSKSIMRRHLGLLEKLVKFHQQHPSMIAYTDRIFETEMLMKSPLLGHSVVNFCPGVNQERIDKWSERINNTFKLIKTQRQKQYWGPPELRVLIEQCFKELISPTSRRCFDMIIQHIFLWTLLLLPGCRPGSLLSNHDYPNDYMHYKHLALCRTPIQGQFDLLINIVTWKGGVGSVPGSVLQYDSAHIFMKLIASDSTLGVDVCMQAQLKTQYYMVFNRLLLQFSYNYLVPMLQKGFFITA
ncbi:hypothetical protein IW262DRAFT_1485336 [Armillaria fumosa]|nr:hypothetical protein IW262DRAFT_1485336 [Armillaria fumosa]